MSKIGLIIEREYKTRVLKKSFILLTLLTPVLLVALMLVPLWLSTIKDDTKQHIVVIDKSGMYEAALQSNELYTFDFTDRPLDTIRNTVYEKSELTGILYISGNLATDTAQVILYSDKQAKMETVSYLSGLLDNYVEDQKIAAYNIPNLREMVENSRTNINITTVKWDEDGKEQKSSAELALTIGILSAFIIYMFILIYGGQVMSGVIQEKTNRIVEVIVSSVKPFELMMGKIIGIALVGLTQMLLWVVLTVGLSTILGGSLFAASDMNDLQAVSGMQAGQALPSSDNMAAEIYGMLSGYDFVQLLVMFVLYFLGGYLLYASLFAAVGSAVESETDTNQFSLPLSIPIIFALYAAIYSAQNPDGPLAFWCSLIPFTSPIVMLVRIPFGVPAWQLILSFAILVLSFAGTTWMAGKIYRTGILMYGKKNSWKEMWKWLTYRAK